MNKISSIIINLIFLFSISSCTENKVALNKVLHKAGANKVELQEFLTNYSNDTLKLKAAEFLVAGIENCYTYDILVKDSESASVDFNLYQTKINRTNLMYLLDSLGYNVRDTVIEDLTTIRSEYLTQNLEQATDMWQNKPWAKKYTYELFSEFILPHRIGNESLDTNWRTYFQEKYLPILDTLQGNDKAKRVFKLIRSDIMSWYWFANNTIDLKPTMNLDEILSCRKGNCVDLANVYLYALRAIGVAAAIDYIPLWGRANYGHCELVYWDENNQPRRCQTGKLLASPAPKVYRNFYSKQKNNLADKVKSAYDIPPYLVETTYRDVTNEYVKTSTIAVKPSKKPKNNITYLSVYNAGYWKPVAWSDSIAAETGAYLFKDMGRNIVYLPTVYFNKKNVPVGVPVMIKNDGQIESLSIVKDSLTVLTFQQENKNKELYYWDNKWVKIGKGVAIDNSLRFENVPSNTLYRLINPKGNKMERIFTYKKNKRRNW